MIPMGGISGVPTGQRVVYVVAGVWCACWTSSTGGGPPTGEVHQSPRMGDLHAAMRTWTPGGACTKAQLTSNGWGKGRQPSAGAHERRGEGEGEDEGEDEDEEEVSPAMVLLRNMCFGGVMLAAVVPMVACVGFMEEDNRFTQLVCGE